MQIIPSWVQGQSTWYGISDKVRPEAQGFSANRPPYFAFQGSLRRFLWTPSFANVFVFFCTVNPRIALGSKTSSQLSFWIIKNSVQHWALFFREFSWIWSGYKMQQSGRQSVHQKLFGMTSNTCEFFLKLAKFYGQNGQIQSISIVVIQVIKSNFPTTATSQKVSPSVPINERQPEIAIWPPKTEILRSLELW